MRLTYLAVAIFALGLGKASACPDDGTIASARAAYDLGLKQVDDGDFPGALAAFKTAYAACPTFEVLYNIGQTQFKLEQWLDAFETLSRFLREGQDKVSPEDRIQAEDQLHWLSAHLGELEIIPQPPDATVTLDGKELGQTELSELIRIMPGPHRITASLAGHRTMERTVDAVPGKVREVVLILVPLLPPPEVVAPAPSRLRSTVAYVLGGVGIVAGGAALGVYLWNRDRYHQWQTNNDKLSSMSSTYEPASPSYMRLARENNDLSASLTRANHAMWGLGIAAGAAVVTGAGLLVLERRSSKLATNLSLHWVGGASALADWRLAW